MRGVQLMLVEWTLSMVPFVTSARLLHVRVKKRVIGGVFTRPLAVVYCEGVEFSIIFPLLFEFFCIIQKIEN